MGTFDSTQEQRDEAQKMADEQTAEALAKADPIRVVPMAKEMCEAQGKKFIELDDHRVTKFVAYALKGKAIDEDEVKAAIQLWIDTAKYA